MVQYVFLNVSQFELNFLNGKLISELRAIQKEQDLKNTLYIKDLVWLLWKISQTRLESFLFLYSWFLFFGCIHPIKKLYW